MKVFITGSTGFVGREVTRQLIEAGHQVRALVRKESKDKLTDSERLELVNGDITEPASLDGLLTGCDAAIHLVGIIREFPDRGITFDALHVDA